MITYLFFRLFEFIFKITPFWLIYLLSDILFFLLYKVFGYRKQVVWKNLKNSFPEKTETELKKINKGFYKNLADIFMESMKGLSMSKKILLERYKVVNADIVDKYYEQDKSVIAVASHFANWEWGVLCLSLQFKHASVGLYKPLTNKHIDKYMKESRAAWGMHLLPIGETSNFIEKKNTKPAIYFMVADQSPARTHQTIWVDFLNRDTACLNGPEKYAKKYDLPVVYGHVRRLRRGFYEMHMSLVEENPLEKEAGEITRTYMQLLEKFIREEPQNWLWSHNRWKRKRGQA